MLYRYDASRSCNCVRSAGRPQRPWERFLAEERSNVMWAENGQHLPLFIVHGTEDKPEENSGVLIDRYEELLAARMRCDPEREAARIAELDRERRELVESAMPRYAAVAQAVKAAQAARRSPGDRPRESVTLKKKP